MSEAATVLVIEDESQIRRFVRAALEDEGCRVYEAENAARGLAEAATARVDEVDEKRTSRADVTQHSTALSVTSEQVAGGT